MNPKVDGIYFSKTEKRAKSIESVIKEAVLKRQRIQQLAERSFDEILKPFRDEIETSGISDEKLNNLFRNARREVSQARRNK